MKKARAEAMAPGRVSRAQMLCGPKRGAEVVMVEQQGKERQAGAHTGRRENAL